MNALTLVFVTFNSKQMISDCLSRLVADSTLRLIVVDNNSNDDTLAVIRARFPTVAISRQETNLGYGRAANVILRTTPERYVLVMNPDLIATPADIHRLLAHAEQDVSEGAIWAPATRKADFTGEHPQSVEWVSGSAMLLDVGRIRKIGLFDENIFLFSEETDLCERAIRAGYSIKLCKDLFFDHLVGQSTRTNPKIDYMKWWHFGWSQSYRMVKNGHCALFRSPRIKHLVYRIHSWIALSSVKRRKWMAKADGTKAYLRGEPAFRPDGSPQMSPP